MSWIQITNTLSAEPAAGGEIRNHQLLGSLRKLGYAERIAMAALGDFPPKTSEWMIRQRFSTAQVKSLIAALQSNPPCLLLLEGASLVDLVQPLRSAFPHARIVIDFHNIESDLLRQMDISRLPAGARWSAGLLYGRRWRLARQAEFDAAIAADAIWACSEADAARARAMGLGGRIDVVPNPVPAWCEMLPAPDRTGAPAALFVGQLAYRPNKLAVRQLARRIMPGLLRRAPLATLVIAGRNAGSRMIKTLQRADGCHLVESPADLAPLYQAANMVLLPIRHGGGTRIKVIEALAVGRPIIATGLAVEGLGLVPGTHYLRAETSADFVRATLELAANPALSGALVAAGRAHVLAGHGEEAIDGAVRMAAAALMAADTATAR
ncbi:glycosyltransferase involved in cell wall biosynthesis [Hoeflea marina]|uniref:Glycosyltransferase involved in cell wall biosynthesis n=1 Tax=Hoeflea marina TaxID=274592 RepID=A0A317PGE8_9HYPH|nr:glycosyltransferase family 4 protein [Hoeflea marina]PWV99104.1 glycosyltransferase involved in cell wall biosynthesis [Hoeflea marina]